MKDKKDIYAEYKEGIDKWYFVGTTDGPNLIVNTTKVLNTGHSEYGYINHLTPPYKTRELLVEHCHILDKPCVECGGVVMTHYHNNESMIARNMCFGCNHFTDFIKRANHPNIMIVNHIIYSVVSENPNTPSSFKGFGGAKFVFVKDGNTIESTNVWCGGDIPKHFWNRIPDNASMINGREPIDISKL